MAPTISVAVFKGSYLEFIKFAQNATKIKKFNF